MLPMVPQCNKVIFNMQSFVDAHPDMVLGCKTLIVIKKSDYNSKSRDHNLALLIQ